ncbi:MAG: MraY family glycosyltransferase [Planctomycetota bacterium]
MSSHLVQYLQIFLIALAVSYLATFLVKWLTRRLGIIDKPGPEKIHAKPVPRLGGVAIFLGFIISVLVFGQNDFNWPPRIFGAGLLIGSTLTLLIGIIDDIKRVPAIVKLLVLFAVTFILAAYGVILNFPLPHVVNLILTLLWLVGVTSAFNAIDNMDGLASGLAFIAATAYLVVAIQTYQWTWGILAVALMGANLGFLFHNFHQASIFMGDSGSFFLGFTLAALGMMGGWSSHPVKASIIPLIILGVPLFDFAYIVITRQKKKLTKTITEIVNYTGHDHLSHRLNRLGLNMRQTVLFVYLIALALSLGAVILRNTSHWEALLLLGQFFLVMIIIIILMGLSVRNR